MFTPQQTYQGSIGQYVLWRPTAPSFTIPNFSLSSERLKLYDAGYVDIGATGESTGLIRPTDYFLFSVYDEFPIAGGDHLNRGTAARNASWRQVGASVTISAQDYNLVANYTPTEQDDVGPFTGVFTVSAQAQSVIIVTANMSSTVTVSATAAKLLGVIENLSATASVSAAGDKIRTASASLVATGSKLTVAVKTGRTLVDMPVVATLGCVGRADFSANANLNSQSELICAAVKTSRGTVSAQAAASVAAANTRVRNADSTINSAVTVSTSAAKTAILLAALSSQAVLTGSPFTTYQGQAALSAQAQVTANATAGYIASSAMTSSFTINILAGRLRDTAVSMTALNFVFAIGTKITLDPYYQLVVKRETNIKKISQETAILTVDSESRVNTVLIDTTTIIVPSETRVWHIPFSPQVGTRRVQ
jgi:hypothetical protein